MPEIAFVNGRFVPWHEAVVSIDDRGFQFGDGVYEVIRTYKGQPFRVDAHLERLARSSEQLKLPSSFTPSQWMDWIRQGLDLAQYSEAKVYIQVTRGAAPRDHAFPHGATPTTVMTIRPLHPVPEEIRTSGVTSCTCDDLRWGRCDIKSVNLLANVLAREEARHSGVFEAILVKEGLVTEGSVSNVMAVHGGTLRTAPEGARILSGVTRAVVLELARREGIPVEERFLSVESLYRSDEVFITGTTVEVLGVVEVDGRRIGDGSVGTITKLLSSKWTAMTG